MPAPRQDAVAQPLAGRAMRPARKARAIALHHVALDVGDIDAALRFYGSLFDFRLLDRTPSSAFLEFAGQFLVLQKGEVPRAGDGRHLGVVVDDTDAVRQALADAGLAPLPGPFLRIGDPWGNRVEIVSYD